MHMVLSSISVKRAGNWCFFQRSTFRQLITPILFDVIIAKNHSFTSKKIKYHSSLKISISDIAYVKIGCLLTLDLWSDVSAWILISVSFFNSTQLLPLKKAKLQMCATS